MADGGGRADLAVHGEREVNALADARKVLLEVVEAHPEAPFLKNLLKITASPSMWIGG